MRASGQNHGGQSRLAGTTIFSASIIRAGFFGAIITSMIMCWHWVLLPVCFAILPHGAVGLLRRASKFAYFPMQNDLEKCNLLIVSEITIATIGILPIIRV